MTKETVATIIPSRIVHAGRQTKRHRLRSASEQATQLTYFLTIIETMLCEGSHQQVCFRDLAEFVGMAREKADALHRTLLR